MAEEKKPKIDLKARLGKKTITSPGGPSIPPPVGLPKPSGIPAPPFQSQPSRPKVDASNPYSAISAEQAPARAEPQAIKVEMSEEVVAAQRKGRAKVAILAVVTAFVGGLVGFAVGSGVERGKGAEKAIAGAGDLAKEIDDTNAKIEELAEVLKSAREKLSSNKYPEEEVSKLGGIDIPFSGANLTGKGIGRFKPEVVTLLINFAGGATEANEQKDKIRNILTGAKPAITDYLAQKETPKVRWGAYFENGPYGPWVSMQALPDPFLVKPADKDKDKKKDEKAKPFKWPEDFKISQRGKEYKLKRFTSGDPSKNRGDPEIIPVNPDTQDDVCPTDTLVRLTRELRDMETVLRGDKSDPANEKDGLIDTGKVLLDQIKSIGKPG
ncbi:MAG: hypothetical protein KC776_42715 [Myxococcales bacterium]|nr:hypothetical protein [Myxococcales bacterium]MCB9577487.1 hypothetical protein [Polyangiaceae bacterium]